MNYNEIILIKCPSYSNKPKYLTLSCFFLLFLFLCQVEPSVTTSDAAVDLSSFKNVHHLELPKVKICFEW
jgi:hypothetical protein